jgi:hypothetical protein
LDHCGIFLMIAGSYTPFTLGVVALCHGLGAGHDRSGPNVLHDQPFADHGASHLSSVWIKKPFLSKSIQNLADHLTPKVGNFV